MFDYKYLEKNTERIEDSLKKRGYDFDIKGVISRFQERNSLMGEVEAFRSQINSRSKEIGDLMKSGEKAKAEKIKQDVGKIKKQMKEKEEKLSSMDSKLHDDLLIMPNMLHESVPEGKSEEDNELVRQWGDTRNKVKDPKEHHELGEKLGILDFARGAKVAGARFTSLKGPAARLELALIRFMISLHRDDYLEVMPPFIVNKESMTGTGQLPKFAEDAFKIEGHEYYLVPTAEVPVTNFHRDEVIPEKELPLKYVAYTPCFRAEAGSYGKDVKGMIRQHQFNKVELVKFTRPEDSYEEHEKLTKDAERVLQKLGLPYRVVSLCSADIGFAASKCYDIEVWLPGQGRYREISSCSNFEDFQARRANIRYKPEGGGKTRYVHTLNGSGLAIGRTLIAIMENYQDEDGNVIVPEALKHWMGDVEKITPIGSF